jgi:hypothetical protein
MPGREIADWAREGSNMKWTGLYLLGYVILMVALGLALWKTGVLQSLGAFWTGVAVLGAVGVGIILAVTSGGKKETIEIDKG